MSIRSEFKRYEKSRGMMSSEKIRRLANLSKWADITVGMDDMENTEDISRAVEAVGTTINVVIEIAFGRCGVDAGEPALALAKRIVELKGLKFKGLFAHQGSYAKFEERKRMIRAGLKKTIDTKHLLEDRGRLFTKIIRVIIVLLFKKEAIL